MTASRRKRVQRLAGTPSWVVPALLPVLIATAAPSVALSHEPPFVMDLSWSEDPEQVLIYTNRGLIQGRVDGGYSLLCQAALHVRSSERVDVLRSTTGSLFFGTSGGLLRSDDRGCTITGADPLGDTPIYALQQQPGAGSRWLVLTAEGEGRTVQASSDEGATWEVVASIPADEYYENLQFSRSDPKVVYVDGLALGMGAFTHFVAASADGGVTWRRHELPLLENEGDASLLAVSPANHQHILVKAHDNDAALMDRLLVSLDGGRTFNAPLQLTDLASARFSPDGARVYVTGQGGLWVSTDTGATFQQRRMAERLSCAQEWSTELLACGYPLGVDQGFHGIARSLDQGKTFEPLMAFEEVDMPVSCGRMSETAIACEEPWADWKREFSGDRGVPQDAGAPIAPLDAAAPPGVPRAQPREMDTLPVASPPGSDSTDGAAAGCSCQLVGRSGRRTNRGAKPGTNAGTSPGVLAIAIGLLGAARLGRHRVAA